MGRRRLLLGSVGLAFLIAACGGDALVTPDGDAGHCEVPCGDGCCAAGQSCVEGKCEDCVAETGPELCAKGNRVCGPLTATDRCGHTRTVDSCGPCAAGTVCNAAGSACECAPESAQAFCQRLKKDCGSVTADDNCGVSRTFDCGSCPTGQTCDQQTNLCSCKETDDEFCARLQVQCGSASAKDKCGQQRTVSECGPCDAAAVCDQGFCRLCLKETDDEFCARLRKNCGEVSAADNCGLARTVPSCGSCTSPKECAANNACALPGGPSNDDCDLPELLTFDPTTGLVVAHGDTTGANDSGDGSCSRVSGRDVVYEFTLDNEMAVEFTVTPDAGSLLKPHLYLRTVCDQSYTDVGCMAGEALASETLSFARLQPGTYFLWVDGSAPDANGPFTLTGTMSTIPVPGPDACFGLQPLSFDASGLASVTGDTRYAAAGYTGSCATGGLPFDGPEQAFTFSLGAPKLVTATVTRHPADRGYAPAVYIRSACTSAADEVACGKGTPATGKATAETGVLQPGTYYVFVDGVSGSAGRFTLEVTAVTGSDNSCAKPTPITFTDGAATIGGDTAAPGLPSVSGSTCGGQGPEMVYSFSTSTVTKFEAKVRALYGSSLVPVIYLRATNCAAGTQFACGADSFDSVLGQYSGSASLSVASLPAGDYYLFVDSYGASNRGAFTLDLLALEPAANDTCGTADHLIFDANGVATVTGDTRRGFQDGDGACNGASGPDLVYRFANRVEQQVEIELTPAPGSALRPNVYLRSACADKATELICGVAPAAGMPLKLTLPRLPAADTYYLWVDSFSAGAAGPFSLSVATSPSPNPPGNDQCRRPEPLVFDASGRATVLDGSTTAATNDYAGACAVAGAPHSGPDLVYSLELSAPASITARVTRKATTAAFKPVVYIRRETCDSTAAADQAACANETGGTAFARQTNARVGTYYVIVDGANGSYGDFDLEVTVGAASGVPDSCFSAQPIDVSSGMASVTGDTSRGLDDAEGSCNAGSAAKDLVYSFVTGSVLDVDITVTPSAGSALQPTLYVRKSCDLKTSEVDCSTTSKVTNETLRLKRLPAGTWFVWVDGSANAAGATSGAFTLDISTAEAVIPPANDTCLQAEVIALSSGTVSRTGTTVNATNDSAGLCHPSMPGGDVVYELTIPGTDHVSLTAKVVPDAGATGFQPAVYLRSSCDDAAPAAEIACSKYTNSMSKPIFSVPDFAPGTYYLVVDSLTATSGAFTLEVTTGPARDFPDTCASAKLLQFAAGKATVIDDTTFAGADADSLNLNCRGDGNGADFVYKIDTTGQGSKNLKATLTYTGATHVGAQMYLRTVCDTVNKAEEIACAYAGHSGPITITKGRLPAGVYYLWVDGGSDGDRGPFRLDVELSDGVSNDVCSGAEPLMLVGGAALVAGRTIDATHDYKGTAGCASLSGPDVVYSFVITGGPQSATATVRGLTTGYEPGVYIRSDCTTEASQVACGTNTNGVAITSALELSPGTYYVIVDGRGTTPGEFELELTLEAPQALPNNCVSAKQVQLDATGHALLAGDNSGATDDFQSLGATGCTGTTGQDLVYFFDTNGLGVQDLLVKATFSNSAFPALSLRRVCQGATASDEVACSRATSTAGFLSKYDLPEGVYYLVVDVTTAAAKGSFALELQLTTPPAPPRNGTCADALDLRFDASGKATMVATTRSGTNADSGKCGTMNGPETVWRFTLGQESSVVAKVTREASTPSYSPAIYLRNSACTSTAAADQLGCATDSNGVAMLRAAVLPAGTYYVFVDGTGGTSGNYTLEVTTGPAVHGDTCADAVRLDVDPVTGVATVTSDTSFATKSGDGSCNWEEATGPDLVYLLELSAVKNVDIVVKPTPGSAFRPHLYVRRACDMTGSANELGCVYESTSLSFKKVPPGIYYLWVDSWSAGPFAMTVTTTDPPPPPTNDLCSGASELHFVNGRATENGDTTWAYDNATGTCDSSATAPDVYYWFELTQESSVVAKVTRGTGSSSYNPTVYLRRNCGSGAAADQVACAVQSSGTAIAGVPKLSPGIYYVVVDGQAKTQGTFSLEVTTGPVVLGDTCADAVELPPFDPATGVAQISADNTAATNASNGSCNTSSGMDVVFKFTLDSAKKVDVAVAPSAGSGLQPMVYVRSTCDQTITEFSCKYNSTAGGTASISYPTLAAGTYYVWVDSYSATSRGPFTLKVTAVDPVVHPPSNDVCTGAEVLDFSVNPLKATASGDTSNAVNDSSGTCAIANGPDVVYKFTTSEPRKVVAKVTRVPSTSTFEPVVYLRRGCGSPQASEEVTCAKHTSGTAIATVNNLSDGTWYVVVDGLKSTFGSFNLEVTLDEVAKGPDNESCFSAKPLTLNGTTAQAQGSTTGGVSEAGGVSCATAATAAAPDVVYSIDVTHPGQRLKATLTPSSTFAPALYIRRSCGSVFPTDELACKFDSAAGKTVVALARDLDVGTYFLWVDGGTSTVSNANGTFTLDVDLAYPNVPGNDMCPQAAPLSLGAQVTGDTTDASLTYGPFLPSGACSALMVKGPDVVYSYTPSANGNFTVTLTPNGFDAVLWYSAGTCEVAACAGKSDSVNVGAVESLTVNGVAGTTYYFFVDAKDDQSFGQFTIRVQ